jgi:DNA-binding NarL/FixJ family response regulator
MDVNVLIVDPGEVYRRALTSLLDREGSDLHVVGQARTPADAAAMGGEEPSVVVLGARRSDDHQLVIDLKRSMPNVNVVVISLCDDGPTVVETLRAGALGFVPMTASEDEIIDAITTVAGGRPSVHASVAGDALMYATHEPPPAETANPDEMLESLTRREREILSLLAEGIAPADIAEKLFVSRRTVETHLANTYRKLGVHGRIDAIRRLELDRTKDELTERREERQRRGA